MPTTDARAILTATAHTASSPFVGDDDAFTVCGPGSDGLVRWALIVGEVDFIPGRRYTKEIATSGEFAFAAGMAIVDLVGDKSGYRVVPLTAYPDHLRRGSEDGPTRGVARLRRHARRYLQERRDDEFANVVMTSLGGHSDGEPAVGLYVLRLNTISETVARRLLPLVESGVIEAIVGLDYEQPDLSSEVLYRAVTAAVPHEDGGAHFYVPTDVQITRELTEAERTGLFHRDQHAPGLCRVVTCYARMAAEFPPVCLDIVTLPAKQVSVADAVVASLVADRPIVREDVVPGVFGANVAVPIAAEDCVLTLDNHRKRTPVDEHYEAVAARMATP